MDDFAAMPPWSQGLTGVVLNKGPAPMGRDFWAELKASADATPALKTLFAEGQDRFSPFSARFGDMLLDFSRTSLTAASLA
ncbi:MAG TPA: hypothetical protein VEQ16_12345, partial [Acidocella sp.]|nr:hypothetical protein [Acidocella sp.]